MYGFLGGRRRIRLTSICMLWVLFLFLNVSLVLGLGVIPSSQEISYDSGKVSTHQLKLVNNDERQTQVLLYVEGELSQHVNLQESVVDFAQGEKEKIITYTFSHPENFAHQGKYEAKIVAREIPPSGSQIAASLSVVSKVILVIPYEGTYAQMRLFVGKFETGKEGNFVIEVNNLGTLDITQAQAFVSIRETRSNKVVEELSSVEERISVDGKKHFTLPWTPHVAKGTYTAVARIAYDGNTIEDQKVFSIGEQIVSVQGISVDNFNLGGVAKFDLLLRNEWNDIIEGVYAQVSVYDGSELYESSVTQTVTLNALEEKVVNAYWDTDKVVPGAYDLVVTLFYNGFTKEQRFPIVVTQNSIDTGLSGNVIGSTSETKEEKTLNAVYILIILVVIVLALNIMLLRRFMKKRQ